MADLCSRSEQCENDVLQKILKAGIPYPAAKNILDFLISDKFIDNARFARAYARDKVRFSGWGRRKIKMMLAAKRISSEDITEAIEAIDLKEYAEALKRAGVAKARNLNLNLREDSAKFYRHLIGRGFESKYVVQLMEAIRKRQNGSL